MHLIQHMQHLTTDENTNDCGRAQQEGGSTMKGLVWCSARGLLHRCAVDHTINVCLSNVTKNSPEADTCQPAL